MKMDLETPSENERAEIKAKKIEEPYDGEDHSIPASRMASPRAMQTIKMESEIIANEMKDMLEKKQRELDKV